METGYEAFSFYYDQLTENVEYPQRAAYFHKLIQKYCQSEGGVVLDLACGTGSLSEGLSDPASGPESAEVSPCGPQCSEENRKDLLCMGAWYG